MQLKVEFQIPKTPLFTGKGAAVVARELETAMEYSVNLAQQAIVPLTPVDRGMLRAGVQTSVLGESASLVGKVFNPLGYALAVELGARPHFPPVAPLEAWARRKLGQAGLGFVIARAIARRGTKGALMFTRAFEKVKPRIEARFQLALQRIRERLEGGGGR